MDSSSGTIYPTFDADTNVLYLAGRGDGNIRYLEFLEGNLYFL
jgi:coronin-1B/1C/6